MRSERNFSSPFVVTVPHQSFTDLIRRPPSPESPQPSRTFQPEAPLLSFQPQEDPPLQRVGLVEYIKGYNRKRKDIRLNVWCPSTRPHDGALPSPAIIRFTIRDVLAVFLTLGYSVPDSTIIVEEATAFGTNEKVGQQYPRLWHNCSNQ